MSDNPYVSPQSPIEPEIADRKPSTLKAIGNTTSAVMWIIGCVLWAAMSNVFLFLLFALLAVLYGAMAIANWIEIGESHP